MKKVLVAEDEESIRELNRQKTALLRWKNFHRMKADLMLPFLIL